MDFRKGKGCVDQIFTLRQLSEKYIGKGRSVGHNCLCSPLINN